MTDPSTRPIFDTILILSSLACLALAFARFAGLSDSRAALIHPGPDRWYLDGPGMPEGFAPHGPSIPVGGPASPSPIAGQPAGALASARQRSERSDYPTPKPTPGPANVLDNLPDYWPVTITAGTFAGELGTFLGEVGGIYAGDTFYFVGISGGRVTAVAGSAIAADSSIAFDLADDAPVE